MVWQCVPHGHSTDISLLFLIAGIHQHSYNHVALSSPIRTPKNGKKHQRDSATGSEPPQNTLCFRWMSESSINMVLLSICSILFLKTMLICWRLNHRHVTTCGEDSFSGSRLKPQSVPVFFFFFLFLKGIQCRASLMLCLGQNILWLTDWVEPKVIIWRSNTVNLFYYLCHSAVSSGWLWSRGWLRVSCGDCSEWEKEVHSSSLLEFYISGLAKSAVVFPGF